MSSTPPSYVLAVDLGSGGPKVALVASTGEVVAQSRDAISLTLLPGGGAEQDPDEWWSVVSRCVRRVLAERAVPVEQIVAVSCTGQWSVTVAVDRQGNPLAPAISWMDSRGARYVGEITRGFPKIEGYGAYRLWQWLRLTAAVPTHSGADALAHILFLKHERPEVYRQCWKLLEPMDFFNLRLTGRAAASYATVFPYMLADNRRLDRLDYSPRLLSWSGIDREKLPELYPVTQVLGTLTPAAAEAWGLLPGTRVVMATGDSHAAALGSGAVGDGEAHVCVGTSSWLTCHVPWRKFSLTNYLTTMPSAFADRYLVVAEQGPAGKCVDVLARQWFFPPGEHSESSHDPVAALLAAAETSPPGSRGLVFLPWLNGSGPPRADGLARGGFLNQSLAHSRADACRAVLEGVAGNLRWLLETVERFVGRRQAGLPFIGGGARSPLWCQIMADVLDRPIHQVADPTLAIARGAGFAALMALGHLNRSQLPGLVQISQTFEPNPALRGTYDALFRSLVASYKQLKPQFPAWARGPAAG